MRIITRPLKAPTDPVDLASLQNHLPLYASDKEDGIRCLICPKRGPITGQMKPIPNRWIRHLLNTKNGKHLDGEIVAIDCEGGTADFNDTQSAVMTQDGQPQFEFRVFDCYENIYDHYVVRKNRAWSLVRRLQDDGLDYIQILDQHLCRSIWEIESRLASALDRNKEGLMLRIHEGWYKEGRSTFNEGYLLKVKPFADDEAFVVDIEEEKENCNPAKVNERGLAQRSKHKANLKGKGMVGALICKWQGKEIRIGSGIPELLKSMWWDKPALIMGKHITFKYQRHGMKLDGLPRSPIFKSIRDPRA